MSHRVTWAVLAFLPLAACGTAPQAPPPMAMPEPAPAAPSTPFADGNFGTRASELNRFIVEASRVAVTRARTPAIRGQAQRLVTAHEADLSGLQRIATAKGGELPASLSTQGQTMMADLEKAGRAFEHDYVLDMVNAHRDLVGAYRAEISEGADPELKGFAAANLQPTQRHLSELQRLAGRR